MTISYGSWYVMCAPQRAFGQSYLRYFCIACKAGTSKIVAYNVEKDLQENCLGRVLKETEYESNSLGNFRQTSWLFKLNTISDAN